MYPSVHPSIQARAACERHEHDTRHGHGIPLRKGECTASNTKPHPHPNPDPNPDLKPNPKPNPKPKPNHNPHPDPDQRWTASTRCVLRAPLTALCRRRAPPPSGYPTPSRTPHAHASPTPRTHPHPSPTQPPRTPHAPLLTIYYRRSFVMEMLLHCADTANPARPERVYRQWSGYATLGIEPQTSRPQASRPQTSLLLLTHG